MVTARAEVVGSLLRPRELVQARERLGRGEIGPPEFKRVEDAAVEAAIRVQEDAGLAVLTDGEMRRLSFQSQLTEAVEGFSDWELDAFLWGDWRGDEVGNKRIERPPIAVVDRLRRRRFLCVEEFVYARGHTQRCVKVTLPSPSLFANFYDPQRSRGAYPSLESFLAEVTEILCEEVDELVRLGCEYVQLDAPHYPLLLDPTYRDFYASRGWPAERWLELGLELDNTVIAERAGVVFGLHLCRGNQQSRWLVEGGYDWLAQRLFPRVRAERLLLEYDDARSGGFAPLAAVPPDKTVVLGLVTTKTGRQETIEELQTRIHQAAHHIPLERLALSPSAGSPPPSSATPSPPPTSKPNSAPSSPPPNASGDNSPQHRQQPDTTRPRMLLAADSRDARHNELMRWTRCFRMRGIARHHWMRHRCPERAPWTYSHCPDSSISTRRSARLGQLAFSHC